MSKRATLLALLLLLGMWEAGALAVRSAILPDPWSVTVAFVGELPRGLAWHTLISAWRVVASIVLAVTLAVPLGLALGQMKKLDRLVAPLVYLTYPIPKIVLLPIVLLFLGLGDLSKIFIITLILFYQVLVVVRDAAGGIRPELVLSVRSLGARRRQLYRYVYLPACLPAILTALRVSTGTAIAVLFFAESFATREGLGYYIIDTWASLSYTRMYAGVLAMSLLGLALYIGLDWLESRLCRWVKAA
jgi:ABC-type nitrate/sulfonate/bicarbonate transport system permease component